MRLAAITVLLLLTGVPSMPMADHCEGALLAMAQEQGGGNTEKKTPPGEWCQRPPTRTEKAHACACHKHDCNADPNDEANLSAHTDSACLNYCTTSQCRCAINDCP